MFTAADDKPSAPPVAVLSHHAWQSTYASDPSIVGSTLVINGHPFTVIGIGPPGFFGDTLRSDPPELWVPLQQEPLINSDSSLLRQPVSAWLRVIGRLKPGATIDGMVHALTLLAVVLLLSPVAIYVPLATLAAVLFVVAYNMSEWREIGGILRLDWADKSVWLITFVLTVIADLTLAVEIGMALAALLYIYRVTETTSVSQVTPEYIEDGRVHVLQDKQVPSYVTILRIHGPFLFGMTDKLLDATADLNKLAPIVILRLRNTTAIDATGLHALEALSDRLKRSGRTLLLCGARHQPAAFLAQADFIEHVGKHNIQPHIQAALERAHEIRSRFSGVGEDAAHDLERTSL